MHKALFALLISSLGAAFAADVPRPAPAYSYTVPGGKQINLQDYKGKVVVLEFLLTTCPHCQQLTPTLVNLQNTLGPQGFQVISVAFSEMKDYMPEYMMKYQPNYPAGTATRQQNEAFLQHSTMMRFMCSRVPGNLSLARSADLMKRSRCASRS